MTKQEFDQKWSGRDTNEMSYQELKQYKDDRFTMYEEAGFEETYLDPNDADSARNGEKFKVLRRATEGEVEITFMPIWLIEFEDGQTALCYPEEIAKLAREEQQNQ